MFEIERECEACIKVVGCGGAGGNTLNNLAEAGVTGVELIAVNTDTQDLVENLAHQKLQIGRSITNCLGAGADPMVGYKAAMESKSEIEAAIAGADMLFVTLGLGGGTGTGVAPVVAQAARAAGILCVAVATLPFNFEGKTRMTNAKEGLKELYEAVDTLILIPNERLVDIVHDKTPLVEAFKKADGVLQGAVRGITDIIVHPGLINVDFADVKAIMSGGGMALMGMATASGEGRALAAAEAAINSPLLDNVTIEGATGVLVNVSGGKDLALCEVHEAGTYVQERAAANANIIVGAIVDMEDRDEVHVTVIATGGVKERVRAVDAVEQPREESEPEVAMERSRIRRPGHAPALTREQRRVQRLGGGGARSTPPTLPPPDASPAQRPPPEPRMPVTKSLKELMGRPEGAHGAPPTSEYEMPAYMRRRRT